MCREKITKTVKNKVKLNQNWLKCRLQILDIYFLHKIIFLYCIQCGSLVIYQKGKLCAFVGSLIDFFVYIFRVSFSNYSFFVVINCDKSENSLNENKIKYHWERPRNSEKIAKCMWSSQWLRIFSEKKIISLLNGCWNWKEVVDFSIFFSVFCYRSSSQLKATPHKMHNYRSKNSKWKANCVSVCSMYEAEPVYRTTASHG